MEQLEESPPTTESPPLASNAEPLATEPTLRFVTLNEYCTLPADPQKWIVKNLIPTGGMVNLYAKPKLGKSYMMLSIIEAIIQEKPHWDGFPILKHGPVAYLQIDTPREEWMDRAKKMLERLESDGHGDRLWIADMWNIPNFPFNILNEDQTELVWLKNEMDRIKPIMVVIDTLREVHSGDENDNTVMRNVVAHLIKACRGSVGDPCAIVLVSHQRKDGIQAQEGHDDMMDQNRGASYVSGKMDMILRLTKKRLTYKGRAVGQEWKEIEQDPETHLIHIKGWRELTDDGLPADHDHKPLWDEIAKLTDQYPGISKNDLAAKLGVKFDISRSTAIRRIDEWAKKVSS